ncbi:hypothetical protein HD806DRAFT_475284 [Xylariaceae sp. AK1471]|nr:hypothetical protein HD806DRAFT_475284 [Xylariaceae sp. AK1471]
MSHADDNQLVEIWTIRCQSVLDACSEKIWDHFKAEVKDLSNEFRLWAWHNGVLRRHEPKKTLDNRLIAVGTDFASETRRRCFLQTLQLIIAHSILSLASTDSEETDMTDKKLSTILQIVVDNSSRIVETILAIHQSSNETQMTYHIGEAKVAFKSLCRLGSSFRSAYPLDPMITQARSFLSTASDGDFSWLTASSIMDQLRKDCSWLDEEKLASHVRNIHSGYRKIFTILIATYLPRRILSFLELGIGDLELPITRNPGYDRDPTLQVRSYGDDGLRVQACLQCWNRHEVRRFDFTQWSMLTKADTILPSSGIDFITICFPKILPVLDIQTTLSTLPRRTASASGKPNSALLMKLSDSAFLRCNGATFATAGRSLISSEHRTDYALFDQPFDEQNDIGHLLREAAIQYPSGSGQCFIPADALKELVNPCRVQNELKHAMRSSLSETDLTQLTRKIVYTGRRLFSILALAERVDHAKLLFGSGLTDAHLPIKLMRKGKRWEVRSYASPEIPIECFRGWKSSILEALEHYQWQLVSPIFESSHVPLEYDLHPNVILPFVDQIMPSVLVQELSEASDKTQCVKIHPAHHYFSHIAPGDYFTLKNVASEHQYRIQLVTLRWLANKAHKHVLVPAASFTYQNKFWHVFPTADGNLHDFWANPGVYALMCSRSGMARITNYWLTQQCQGLASALAIVHHSDRLEDERYGRFEQVNPRNVLWFKDQDDVPGLGILKLAHLQETEFYSKRSRTLNLDSQSSGPGSYKAPETMLSRKTAVWALGCLFLEMITWRLCGKTGLDLFTSKRLADADGFIQVDYFYALKDNRTYNPTDSEAVLEWINSLRREAHCSRLFHDLLDLVQHEILVVNPVSRVESYLLAERLYELANRSKEDLQYCTSPAPWPRISLSIQEQEARPRPLISTEQKQHDGPSTQSSLQGFVRSVNPVSTSLDNIGRWYLHIINTRAKILKSELDRLLESITGPERFKYEVQPDQPNQLRLYTTRQLRHREIMMVSPEGKKTDDNPSLLSRLNRDL